MTLHPVFKNILAAHGLEGSSEGRVSAPAADGAESVVAESVPEAVRSPVATVEVPTFDIVLDWYKTLSKGARENISVAQLHTLSKVMQAAFAREATQLAAHGAVVSALDDCLEYVRGYSRAADSDDPVHEMLPRYEAALKLAGAL